MNVCGKYFTSRESGSRSLSPMASSIYRREMSGLDSANFGARTPGAMVSSAIPPKVIIFDREKALKLLDEFEFEEMQQSNPIRARISLMQLNPNLLSQRENTFSKSQRQNPSSDTTAMSPFQKSRTITSNPLQSPDPYLETTKTSPTRQTIANKEFAIDSPSSETKPLITKEFVLSSLSHERKPLTTKTAKPIPREYSSFSSPSEPELEANVSRNWRCAIDVSGNQQLDISNHDLHATQSESQVSTSRVQVSHIRSHIQRHRDHSVEPDTQSSIFCDSFASEVEIIPRKLQEAMPKLEPDTTFASERNSISFKDNSDEDLFAHPVSESVVYLSEDESDFAIEPSNHSPQQILEESFERRQPVPRENSNAILDELCKAPIPVHYSRDEPVDEKSFSTTYTEDLLATMELPADPDPEESLVIAFAELRAAHPELSVTYDSLMSLADFLMDTLLSCVLSDV